MCPFLMDFQINSLINYIFQNGVPFKRKAPKTASAKRTPQAGLVIKEVNHKHAA